MIIIKDVILDKIGTALSLSPYKPVVKDKFPRETAKLPFVLVVEDDNSYESKTLDGIERHSNILYRIEVYSEDGLNVTKERISQDLIKRVDEVMSRRLGFTRQSCQETPNLDTNILRMELRYTCIIDEYRGRIY